MASLTDKTYFPPLEECLTGKNTILSWKLVASALVDQDGDRITSDAVSSFLRDAHVQQLLKNPSKTFEPPTSQTKADFETKTAAINVTQTPNERFNIKTIKDDAIWLSTNVNISQVAALRIVVVEFQSRAQAHLVGPLSTQDVDNIQEAAGVSDAQTSNILALLNLSTLADAETTWADFEKDATRRQRLLAHYLSERRSFMSSAESLVTFMLHSSAAMLNQETHNLRREIVKEAFEYDEFDDHSEINISFFEALIPRYFTVLQDAIKRAQTGPANVEERLLTEQINIDWTRTALTEAIHAMTVSFQILDLSGPMFTTPEIITQWYQIMNTYEFLDSISSGYDLVSELVMPLKSLVCVISLRLVNLNRSLMYLSQDIDLLDFEEPYLASSELLTIIHTAITNAANAGSPTASPVILAWSLILQEMFIGYQERAERRDVAQNARAQASFELEIQPNPSGRRNSAGSIVSIERSPYDLFLTSQSLERDNQLVEALAFAATARGQVYEVMSEMAACLGHSQLAAFSPLLGARVRAVFLEVLKKSLPIVGYQNDTVSCLLAVLSGGRQYWDISPKNALSPSQEVNSVMLRDDELKENYLLQARNRYPYEFLPFVSFTRALVTGLLADSENSEWVISLLLRSPTLTLDWRSDWVNYELIYEDENINSFQLIGDLDLFDTSKVTRRRPENDEKFTIPAGTVGRFVSDSERIAILEYEHSALALLGKRLEVSLKADAYSSALPGLTDDEVAESILLLATVVRVETLRTAVTVSRAGSEAGMAILREASRALPHTKDILTVVSDLMDTIIQDDLVNIDGPRTAVLAACLQFLDAALPVCPGRVWAYMSRTALINGETRAGRLSRITGNLDMLSERCDFLSSAMKFFSNLIEIAMLGAVQRKVVRETNARSNVDANAWLGTSEKVISRVSLAIAQTAVDMIENSVTWRFPSELDRSIVVRDVVGIMQKLLSYTYNLGATGPSNTLTGYLEPAARYVLESFVTASSNSLRFQPLLATLLVAFQIPDSTLYPRRAALVSERLVVVLDFATILLRVSNYLDLPVTNLQTPLFKSASLVARLPAIRLSFKAPAIALLSALVESAGKGNAEPPSLLGYLGPQVARSFIQIASQLDKPFDRVPESISTWKFFSTIMRNRQQWMANCLLTGKTPREALKGDGKIAALSPGSVLSTAMEKLRSIKKLPSREAIAILDFFTSAQNYWPWTIFAMQKDTSFLTDLRAYVRDLKSPSMVSRTDPREAGNQARIAAYIAETFAMQLYHLRQMRQSHKVANDVVNDLDYFLRNGVQVSGYNASLHSNFAKNFSQRYPGISIEDFKRTVLVPRDLGSQFYYALDFAESMLSYDVAWAGSRKNGFRHEMETANLNLSLVEAEITLFHAWEYLLLELSISLLPKNETVAKQMSQVAEQCLDANQRAQPPDNIFVRLAHARANLALTLLQRLADASHLPKDISKLLTSITRAINNVEDPFDKDQISYFRTLLKILFVALRGTRHSANAPAPGASTMSQSGGETSSVAVTQLILTILDRVVAQSFRSLVALVHEPTSPTTPEDLALLTAILQACLSAPGIDQCQVQILNIMAGHNVFQVATSLFSWADKLTDKSGDPIYGELSLLFLLELSAMPTIAEQLACDGLLGHLTSANLAGFMRRANVGPLADNAGAARCYSMWAKGILPLLLNMLGALGATMAPEIAYVLNQFPNLLRAAVDRFEAPGVSRTGYSPSSKSSMSTINNNSPGNGKDTSGLITLTSISEIHSLALLTRVLSAIRLTNAGGQSARDIPQIVGGWEDEARQNLLENVEFWLGSRKVLRERLFPWGQREIEWRNQKPGEGAGEESKCESKLEEKAVEMLSGVAEVLGLGDGEDGA
ncbi:nucleoporin subcomplex protein binding to Pom34-domain-containing protein [Pseudoneurospora amorphoporcata]|uniref:Nucleoporin NUP188 n=1 Tax=Pseudoneurospora amorphoporcata TaxID=241081 RepID=A0AAN6NXX9_9PEZI|nr:nucleoporin subcomplex protein binding to Pom34-domain-containing protein [Pseudoneurospora amorphoporcata]